MEECTFTPTLIKKKRDQQDIEHQQATSSLSPQRLAQESPTNGRRKTRTDMQNRPIDIYIDDNN